MLEMTQTLFNTDEKSMRWKYDITTKWVTDVQQTNKQIHIMAWSKHYLHKDVNSLIIQYNSNLNDQALNMEHRKGKWKTLVALLINWHLWLDDVITLKAQGGDMGTFSMLLGKVQGMNPEIFSFLLIFSNLP